MTRALKYPLLLGLSGAAQSGKDTAAKALIDDAWQRFGFADKLRASLLALDLDPLVDVGVGRITRLFRLARVVAKVRDYVQALWTRALFDAIRESWCEATSADDNWTPSNPALGQCAVTALVVQDYFGGELVRVTTATSHYYNYLQDSTELDLTREQFQIWEPSKTHLRDRKYALSYPATAVRYELLRALVRARIGVSNSTPSVR